MHSFPRSERDAGVGKNSKLAYSSRYLRCRRSRGSFRRCHLAVALLFEQHGKQCNPQSSGIT